MSFAEGYTIDIKKTKEQLKEWIRKTVGDNTVVIGISGGKDSSICAAICVESLGKDKVFGVLMPDGEQKDIDKALKLVKHLGIDYIIINIGEVTSSLGMAITESVIKDEYKNSKLSKVVHKNFKETRHPFNDVYKTNTPARIRMTVLYGVAALLGNARVANTCNLSEDFVGYSTKNGDSAGDFSPLANLTVAEVKALGYELGLPKDLIEKVPSDGMSGKSDEEKLGFTYEELDRYVRTGYIKNQEHKAKIDRLHVANLHKILPMPKFEPEIGLLSFKPNKENNPNAEHYKAQMDLYKEILKEESK